MTGSDMSPEQWQRVRALFTAASKLPDAERAEYLRVECADDQALFDEVMALMVGDEIGEDHLHAAIQSVADSLTGTNSDSDVGHEDIGPYRIVDTLGRGGMGTVYLAERADRQFQHRVAIKVLDQHRSSPELVARFRQERQILANLDHPNIAKLFDGGETADGLPYLVMEYIDGLPITEYCDQKHLTTRARLELMESVCEAVQFAHQNLVIHRDIKPSNILVTENGIPKLLDFGIAKLMRPEDMQHTVAVTVENARMLTPGNASPEQVRGETVTTATDVYSLGVLLYQLLTGQFPYEITSYRPADLERVICDSVPTRPSDRFDLKSGAETVDSIEENSQLRAATPARLTRQLRGDLDNIVLVAMRKEAERRYATVRQLQQDIGNYLQHRPVLARRESLGYLASKFVRRNRWAVTAGTAFLAVVIGLTSFYTLQLAEQRDRAQLEAVKAQEIATFLTDLFTEADPQRSLGEPVSAKQMLDRGAMRIIDELNAQPELQAALMVTIGQSYHNMNEVKTARAHIERALVVAEAHFGQENDDVLRMKFLQGMAMSSVGEFDDARSLHNANYLIHTRISGETSLNAARELKQIAFVEERLSEYESAESKFLEAIDILRNLGVEGQRDLSSALLDYGTLLNRQDRLDEEEAVLIEALAIQERRVGSSHPDYADVVNNLGNHYFRRGDLTKSARYMEEHVELQRKLYGNTGISYGVALANYSSLVSQMGDDESALRMLDEASAIFAAGYGDDSVRYAYILENKANLLMDLERYDEAEMLYLDVLSRLAAIFGTDNPEYAFTESNYGNFLLTTERPDEAVPILQSAAATFESALGIDNSQTLTAKMKLARALMKTDAPDLARLTAVEALNSARITFTNPHRRLIEALRTLAEVHRDRQEYAEADSLFQEAISLSERIEDGPLEQAVLTETEFAKSLFAQGQMAEAKKMLQARYEQLEVIGDSQNDNRNTVVEALKSLDAAEIPQHLRN